MAWQADVTASDGTTRTVDAATISGAGQARPRVQPSINGYFRVAFPVEQDDSWNDAKWEKASATVRGPDGDRLPAEQLEQVRQQATHTELVFRGGAELRTRVTKEVDTNETHLVAQNLVQNNTSYTANVDTPSTSTTTNSTVQSATSTADFTDKLPGPLDDIDPFEITGGNVNVLQSCYLDEAENGRDNAGSFSDPDFSNASAVKLTSTGDYVEIDVTTDYDIPTKEVDGVSQDAVRMAVRLGNPSGISSGHELVYYIDGIPIGSLNAGWSIDSAFVGGGGGNFGWRTFKAPFRLHAGTHTLRLEVGGETSSSDIGVDVIAVLDDRFSYTFDNSTDTNDALSGPELFPDAADLVFQDAQVSRAVTGGRVETSWDDTSNNQALALSNDQGQSFSSSANTATFETDFTDRGPTLRFKATFSRFGSQTSTPTSGINGQTLQDYTLKADLETMPLTVNETFDGQLFEVLNDLAETARGDFVWAVETDGSGGLTVEWTRPGQRDSSRDPDLTEYELVRDAGTIVEKAIVRGKRQAVADERFTANHGTPVGLDHDNIVPGSERVYLPNADRRIEFDRGADYTIAYETGDVTTQSGGDITDGDELAVDYDWKPVGEFTASGVGSPVEQTFNLPELLSVRAAEQAAERIVTVGQTPRNEATYTVPGSDVDFSVVDALDSSLVDQAGETFVISDVEAGLGETTLRLASRETVGEVTQDLRDRIRAISTPL